MEWISIEHEKPEWGQSIIVYRESVKRNMKDGWKFKLPKIIEIINTYDPSVSHWMPLPVLPRDMSRCLCGEHAVEEGYCKDCL